MKSIVFVALLVLSLSRAAVAQEPPTAPANTGAAKAGSATAEKSGAEKYFTDIELVNQNGEKVRFYPDLLQGKTVIINSFFATCQGSCLPITRNLEMIQEALGDRLGKDARIISISVDPTVDTPGELMAFGKKFHARPGWYFLTGSRENVEFVLKKLGQFVENKQDHLNVIIASSGREGFTRIGSKWLLLLVFVAAFSFAGRDAFAQSPLTPQEIRGKQIYTQGTSPSGKQILTYIARPLKFRQHDGLHQLSCNARPGQARRRLTSCESSKQKQFVPARGWIGID